MKYLKKFNESKDEYYKEVDKIDITGDTDGVFAYENSVEFGHFDDIRKILISKFVLSSGGNIFKGKFADPPFAKIKFKDDKIGRVSKGSLFIYQFLDEWFIVVDTSHMDKDPNVV